MVDFRYHALSLVAVFLALGIGIVLGVTVGDSLVSNADRNLRESLRDDVTEAREQVREEQELASRREEVIEETSPQVADGRLRDRRVALVATGELPGDVSEAVEEAVELGGGTVARRAVLDPPEDTDRLVGLVEGQLATAVRGPERQLRLGRRIGRLVRRGGSAALRLRRGARQRFSGDYDGPVDAVVVYRHPPPSEEEAGEVADELELRQAFEEGLSDGLRDGVVGVETLETDPSQVEWYATEAAIASVDNVDLSAGALALVLLLQEAALADVTGERPEGRFGYKGSADAAVPDLSD